MMYQRRWAIAGLLLALILVLAVGVQGIRTHQHFVDAAARERQTLETISILGELHGDFSDAETIWYAYLLTGDELHLKYFQSVCDDVPELRTRLRQTAPAAVLSQIDELEQLIDERLSLMSAMIDDRETALLPVSEQLALVESGVDLRDRIRQISISIEDFEKRRLTEEHEMFRRARRNAWWGTTTGILLAASLVLGGGGLLMYELHAREQTERELQESHRLLEQRVAERTIELTATVAAMQQEVSSHRKTAASLNQSESRFRLLVEVVQDFAIFMLDPDGMIITWNRGAERLKGYTAPEIIGTHFSRFYLPDEVAMGKPERQLANAIRNERMVDEGWRLRKDGSRFWAKVVVTAIRDDQGRHIGFVKITRDLTQQREAEASLRDALEFNRQIVSSVGEGMIVFDRDLSCLVWNPAMEQMLGLSPEQVLGNHLLTLFPSLSDQGIVEMLESMLRGEVAVPSDRHYQLPEATGVRWIAARHYPLRNSTDDIVGIICLLQDVSENLRQQDAIRRSEARFRAVVETASDSVITFDQSGIIENANPATEQMFGYSAADLRGKNIRLLMLTPFTDNPADSDPTASQSIQTQFIGRGYEVQGRRQDGTLFPCDLSVSEFADGSARMFAGIVHDLTERRTYEARLMRAHRLESVGALAGGIAHDLNNVLTPILIAVRMLRKELPPERKRELLDTASGSVEHGVAMIRQLLAFAGGSEGTHVAVDIRLVLNELQTMLQHMLPKSINIQTSFDEELQTVVGDATQLHQVLINLCVNARDAMPDGGTLKLTAGNFTITHNPELIHPEARPGDFVVIHVSDSGTGIPNEIIERIFDPFFTTKPFGKGTGLGLSMVQGIVKGHRGFVNVSSQSGQGTLFSIYLPADGLVPERSGSTDDREVNNSRNLQGQGETVLVVDDEQSIRFACQTALEAAGYSILSARHGNEALELIQQNPDRIRAIVMDMMMPELDGPSTIRELTRRQITIPVIAVSGLPFTGNGELHDHSVTHYLRKPYSDEQLIQAVHNACSAHC